MTRRSALELMAAAPGVLKGSAPLFRGTWQSLKQYRCPAWFRDAKFGIWAHWGPQCAPRQGDWYARNMYIQGSRQYKFHVQRYGHPSKFGYKDVIPLWRAEHWEPETLIRRYKRAGARYFVALGAHCDNFDCWNSKHHRWNAVNYGPRRDVVGAWREAARRNGLRFGVSEHLAWSYDWFNVNKGADKTGPYAGVPYDGNDPKYQDLYFPPHPDSGAHYPVDASEEFKRSWFQRIADLIDQHRPDLVYTDGGAFGQVGLDLIARYYNSNLAWHGGQLEGVYLLKDHTAKTRLIGDYEPGAATLDVERGVVGDVWPEPWHSDTCIGQWFYYDGFPYKTAREVIHTLIDVVSKNGTFLLNFPLLPDGSLDSRAEGVLEDITRWMAIHGEAIYFTRPWKKFGEGPTAVPTGSMSERRSKPFTANDLRFTTKAGKLYIFCLGWPDRGVDVTSLGTAAGLWNAKIANVRLLGSDEKIAWSRDAVRLHLERPRYRPSDLAIAFEISSE